MYDHFGQCGVDPRNIAQRVMEVCGMMSHTHGTPDHAD